MDAIKLGDPILRAIFETTPECIKIVAADSTLLQMNAAGQEMVEADAAAQLEGACIFDVIAPEFRDSWTANHARVCAGERLSWEFDIIGMRGTRRHMETHAVPLQMPGGGLAQLAITRDVTRRKEDDRRLRESDHRYKELLQALPVPIFTTDLDGRLTFFNEAASELAARRPVTGDIWHDVWRLYHPEGGAVPPKDYPMAVTLRERRPVRDQEFIAERPDGTRIWITSFPTPLTDSSGAMTGAINMIVDVTQRKDAERQQKLLIDELNHRVKNTLATVQSLMAQTAGGAGNVEDYRQLVEARLMAMSRAHDQLSRRNWSNTDLREITAAGLAPYLNEGNIILSGEATALPPRVALMLSMVFHELATNAVKFGALSQPEGKVQLGWTVNSNGDGPRLRLQWDEIGGPPVEPRARQGFGSRLVERGIPMELGGKAWIDFAQSGVRCEMEFPLDDAG